MRMRSVWPLFVFVVTVVFVSQSAAQVTIDRPSVAGVPDYNVKLGEAYFDFAALFGVGWDSNRDESADGAGSAFTLTGMLANFTWMPTVDVVVVTNVEAKYIHYFEDSEQSGWRIGGADGAASVRVDLMLDDHVVTVRGTVSSTVADVRVQNSNENQDSGNYEELAYSLGVASVRALTPTVDSRLGYTYRENQSIGGNDSDVGSNLDRTEHEIEFSLSAQLNQFLSVRSFIESTLILNQNSDRDDLTRYSTGVSVKKMTAHGALLSVLLGVDYTDSQGNGGSEDPTGFSPRVECAVAFLSRNGMKHRMSASLRQEPSNVVAGAPDQRVLATQQTTSFDYGLGIPLSPDLSIRLGQGVSYVSDEGDVGNEARYRALFETSYQLTERLSGRLRYQYTNVFDTGGGGVGYDRNFVEISCVYNF